MRSSTWSSGRRRNRWSATCGRRRYERLLSVMETSARPPTLRYHTVSGSAGLEWLEVVRLGAATAPPPVKDGANKDRP